ncbi:ABC transporter permease [Mesorhizobium shangrilense]|uniref:Autoinducer 2 import system permease protein LsrC n=1 Tax=Mesorhizobium shangrilense TaxID=460060 RepID=A0ABV2DSC8_9HYPH
MTNVRIWLAQNYAPILAGLVFAAMFATYITKGSAGWQVAVLDTAANKAVALALISMAQTLVIITRGVDLSAGMIFIMTNCIASALVTGTPGEVALGICGVLLAGALAGLCNGLLVVFGRLPSIIVTLATGSIYSGIALAIRPTPGGSINEDLADFLTSHLFGAIPTSLVLLLAVVLLVWVPFRMSVVGRHCYAAGSAESAAYMSGVSVSRAKLVAYTLSGLLSGIAGLFVTFVTYSGDAGATIGGAYTLNSIAAVVIGGTSLYGGAGGAFGSIFGAFTLRTIDDLLLAFGLPPLWQPLFQGIVLLGAVSLGAVRIFRLRNRMEVFQ